MNDKKITFNQYRIMDISFLSILLIISESLATLATSKWFSGQPVAITLTLTFICIFAMRWTGFAAVGAAVGAVVFCAASGAEGYQYIIYIVGNMFSLLALIPMKLLGKENIRKSFAKTLLFALSAYITMQLGRWLVSLIFEPTIRTLPGFMATEVLSLLFCVVILLLLARQDGMTEDQKSYLFRVQRETEERESEDRFEEDGF